MKPTDIAQALKHLDWTDVPVGNKAVIQQAITALEQASLLFPGEVVGYVTPEVAAGSKDWELTTLVDAPEGAYTEALYAAPVSAAAAVALARTEAHAKGLSDALRACLDKVNEYDAREWAGDASGARACARVIETQLEGLPCERAVAVSLGELAQIIIEYGDARETSDASAVQEKFHAILAALPHSTVVRTAGGLEQEVSEPAAGGASVSATAGLAATPAWCTLLPGWTIHRYTRGWLISEPSGRTHAAHDNPSSDETERVLARVFTALANHSAGQAEATQPD
ncbi:hypothetical protein ACXIVK_27705 [Paraburkholderia caledonica]|jgi:hypothetical protein